MAIPHVRWSEFIQAGLDLCCPIIRSWRRWSRDSLKPCGRGEAGGPSAKRCHPASTSARTAASPPSSRRRPPMHSLLDRFRRNLQRRPYHSAMPPSGHSSWRISSSFRTTQVPAQAGVLPRTMRRALLPSGSLRPIYRRSVCWQRPRRQSARSPTAFPRVCRPSTAVSVVGPQRSLPLILAIPMDGSGWTRFVLAPSASTRR